MTPPTSSNQTPAEKEIRKAVIDSFTDLFDHEEGCKRTPTEPMCGDGCCGGGRNIDFAFECDCNIAKATDLTISKMQPLIQALQSQCSTLQREKEEAIQGLKELLPLVEWQTRIYVSGQLHDEAVDRHEWLTKLIKSLSYSL